MQQTTYSPVFEYKKVHHVPVVTQAFLDFLKGSIEMQVHVTQHVEPPADKLTTANAIVVESIKTGVPVGYDHAALSRPKTEAEVRCDALAVQLQQAQADNAVLLERVQELEKKIVELGAEVPKSALRDRLNNVKVLDGAINA